MEVVAELATSDPVVNTAIKATLVMVFIAVVTLFMFFGGGAMTGATMSGGTMGGIGWMWIPASLMLGLVVLLVWAIFGQKK